MLGNALGGGGLVKMRGVFMLIWVGGSLHNVISVQFFNRSLNFNNVTLNTYVKKYYCLKSCCLLKLSLSISCEVVPTNETIELISMLAI